MPPPTLSGPPACPAAFDSASLLGLARQGNRDAIGELIEHYRPQVEGYLHGKLPGSQRSLLDTADLVQSVLVRAVQRAPRFTHKTPGAFGRFLLHVAHCVLVDHYRSQSCRPSSQPLSESGGARCLTATPFTSAVVGEDCQRLRDALADLAPRDRNTLELRSGCALSWSKIATACDYPSEDAARMGFKRVAARIARQLA